MGKVDSPHTVVLLSLRTVYYHHAHLPQWSDRQADE